MWDESNLPFATFPRLVVVTDLDLVGTSSLPSEADPILIVDSNAVLTQPIAAQRLQAIPGWNGELMQCPHPIDLVELAASNRPTRSGAHSSGSRGIGSVEDVRGPLIPK
jgi:hypothetical protein